MTTNEVARLFDKAKPATGAAADDRDAAAQLRQLQESALGLLAGLDRAPTSLRIRTGQVEIELEWSEPEPAAGAPVAAADGAVGGGAGAAPAAAARPAADRGGGQFIQAPTVGVFYRAPEPGARPFVEPGDVVAPGQQIGILEAMKLMIPVEAEAPARIVEVLVADGAQVEYGERLFAVEPAGPAD